MPTEQQREGYIENILDHYERPRNRRAITSPDLHASGGNPSCGDIVVIYGQVGEDGVITEISFRGEGCIISQAAASMLTERLLGLTVAGVLAMSFTDLIEDLGRSVVTTRSRCATLPLTTAKLAVENYLNAGRLAISSALLKSHSDQDEG